MPYYAVDATHKTVCNWCVAERDVKSLQLSDGVSIFDVSSACSWQNTWRPNEKTYQTVGNTDRCNSTIEGYVHILRKYCIISRTKYTFLLSMVVVCKGSDMTVRNNRERTQCRNQEKEKKLPLPIISF